MLITLNKSCLWWYFCLALLGSGCGWLGRGGPGGVRTLSMEEVRSREGRTQEGFLESGSPTPLELEEEPETDWSKVYLGTWAGTYPVDLDLTHEGNLIHQFNTDVHFVMELADSTSATFQLESANEMDRFVALVGLDAMVSTGQWQHAELLQRDPFRVKLTHLQWEQQGAEPEFRVWTHFDNTPNDLLFRFQNRDAGIAWLNPPDTLHQVAFFRQ